MGRSASRYKARGNGESRMCQNVLKAWNKGERSFDEVVKLTGYTRKQVAYYLPEGIGRADDYKRVFTTSPKKP